MITPRVMWFFMGMAYTLIQVVIWCFAPDLQSCLIISSIFAISIGMLLAQFDAGDEEDT